MTIEDNTKHLAAILAELDAIEKLPPATAQRLLQAVIAAAEVRLFAVKDKVGE